MKNRRNISLLGSIRTLVFLLTIVPFFILFLIFAGIELNHYRVSSDRLQKEILSNQKEKIKQEVESIVQFTNMVRRTNSSSKRTDIQKTLLKQVAKMHFGSQKENYLFIISYNGSTLLNNSEMPLENINALEVTDPHGVKIIQKAKKALEKNPGGVFVYYSWENPETGKITPKISYVKEIPEWQWIVGTGEYRKDIEKTVTLFNKENRNLIYIGIPILFIFVIIILVTISLVFRKIFHLYKNELSTFDGYFKNAVLDEREIDISLLKYSEYSAIAIMINEMIDKKKQLYQHAQHNETKYKTLFYNLNEVVIVTDGNRIIQEVNQPAMFNQFGYKSSEVIGKDILILYNSYDDYIKTGKMIYSKTGLKSKILVRTILKKKNGDLVEMEFSVFTYKDPETGLIRNVSVHRDFSDRAAYESHLKQLLDEKNLLLREIHHRVINNMAVVISLLSLSAIRMESKEVENVLENLEDRIRVMSYIFEFLYKDSELTHISITDFIKDLISSRIQNSGFGIQPVFVISDVTLNVDTLYTLGLLINEIISNSLQHAFTDEINKKIEIYFEKQNSGTLILTLKDNGIGLPDEKYFTNRHSIGMLLINALVEQLNGEMAVETTNGTTYTIIFKSTTTSKGGGFSSS